MRIDFLKSAAKGVEISDLKFSNEYGNRSLSEEQAILFREINKSRSKFAGKYLDPTGNTLKSIVQNALLSRDGNKIIDTRQVEF
jgi:hypothetical protein